MVEMETFMWLELIVIILLVLIVRYLQLIHDEQKDTNKWLGMIFNKRD
jgi:hypothetical protein